MAAYRVELMRSAAKEIERVEPKSQRSRIVERVGRLSADPRPLGSEKLAGSEGIYRIRQGDFRIVYSIDDQVRSVVIVRVAHRREAYR